MSSQITPEQDVRLDTARRLVEQAQQLLLGMPVGQIPSAYVYAAQNEARLTINMIRRCQAPRMWKIADGKDEPVDQVEVIDLSEGSPV